jgi:hypothetical protein
MEGRTMALKNRLLPSGLIVLTGLIFVLPGYAETIPSPDAVTVPVFRENIIHFTPDDSAKYNTDLVACREGGRVITRTMNLPDFAPPVRITAHLVLAPIPKDELEVYDRWDRAGNVRLEIPGGPDVELVKFITAYGGRTEYDVDLSHLAPLLHGRCVFKGFVDTWVSPAWKMDFSLTFAPDTQVVNPDWVASVTYNESVTRDGIGDKGIEAPIDIPAGLHRVLLHYYVSGHCTDGTDADEFVQKDNVISVDNIVVHRFRPWRDDCRQFRPINPYCRRWTDGSWSCDYSRSGWCPGDIVEPLELDLTDHLVPGKHIMRFVIENIRPKDANGNYGYWRVSAQLLGWK